MPLRFHLYRKNRKKLLTLLPVAKSQRVDWEDKGTVDCVQYGQRDDERCRHVPTETTLQCF